MKIAVIGAGLMGTQIACEYALGGHETVLVARRPSAGAAAITEAFSVAAGLPAVSRELLQEARTRLRVVESIEELPTAIDLVIESITEDLAAKAKLLARVARAAPAAVLATNTSSLSISDLGEASGEPERTVGTHYWNPPLLMPLVEVVAGRRTARAVLERATVAVRSLGKRPVLVERDVPGFLWNRLQFALLREALWLVENGVASPETVDLVVREGLARRMRTVGPFETVALGGSTLFEQIARNLFPLLSTEKAAEGFNRWTSSDPGAAAEVRARRDQLLAHELKCECSPNIVRPSRSEDHGGEETSRSDRMVKE